MFPVSPFQQIVVAPSAFDDALLRNETPDHFLWLLSPPWDGVQTRQQHFARRMARLGKEVLYVENPPAWSSALRQGNWRGSSFFGVHHREVEPGLHVMRPAVSFPGSMRSDAVARLNARILSSQLNRWFCRWGWKNYVAWCRVPASVFSLKHLRPRQVVYDVTDDYVLYARHAGGRRRTIDRERSLLQAADTVFVTASELLKKPCLQSARPVLLPNGVDYELFAAVGQPGPIHPLIANIKKPVIGYVGLTSYWMDFNLLAKLGRQWPGQVVMIGPIQPQIQSLAKKVPGVVWAGFVPQPDLTPYLRGMDVLIMPHQVNELRKNSNPLKIWEYLATGKPFVTIDLPALDPARHLAYIAQNHEQFLDFVAQALQNDSAEVKAERQVFARRYSWDRLFDDLLSNLSQSYNPPELMRQAS
jgi:glycosyltransferase involved in cell wall biosynthesis